MHWMSLFLFSFNKKTGILLKFLSHWGDNYLRMKVIYRTLVILLVITFITGCEREKQLRTDLILGSSDIATSLHISENLNYQILIPEKFFVLKNMTENVEMEFMLDTLAVIENSSDYPTISIKVLNIPDTIDFEDIPKWTKHDSQLNYEYLDSPLDNFDYLIFHSGTTKLEDELIIYSFLSIDIDRGEIYDVSLDIPDNKLYEKHISELLPLMKSFKSINQ